MSEANEHRGKLERLLVLVLIVAFCVVALYISTTFKKMPPILKRGIQPSDFPQLVLSAIVLLTLAMAWFDPISIRERLQGTVWGTLALFAVFAALSFVDFFLALAVFAVALTAYWGERRVGVLCVVGVLLPLAIFFLFDQVFEIRFPRGLLTNLWYG